MDNMTRLYREDYPDGLLFLPNEVKIAKAQGWTNTIDIIAKPVPEEPEIQNSMNICACGCGKEPNVGRKYASHDCYLKAMKRGKYRGNR